MVFPRVSRKVHKLNVDSRVNDRILFMSPGQKPGEGTLPKYVKVPLSTFFFRPETIYPPKN